MGTKTNGVRLAAVVAGCLISTWATGCGGIVNREDHARFEQRLRKTSVTVFPAVVRSGRASSHDADSAARIGRAISDAMIAEVVIAEGEVPITGGWRMNQAKMLRSSEADFSTYVKAHPIETEYAGCMTLPAATGSGCHGRLVRPCWRSGRCCDIHTGRQAASGTRRKCHAPEYAFLAEYLIGGGGVGGIHCYVVDDEGTVAWVRLWNSHHRAFAEANLKTPEDCTAFLCNELPQELTPAATGDER